MEREGPVKKKQGPSLPTITPQIDLVAVEGREGILHSMLLGWGLSWQLCQLSFLSSLRASFFEASAGNASDSALHISSALLQLRTGLSGEEWRLCMYFRLIYLTTWVPSCDWLETLALQAVKFLVPCGNVNTVWPKVLVLCVGSNCILPCKGAFVKCLTSGWSQWGMRLQ